MSKSYVTMLCESFVNTDGSSHRSPLSVRPLPGQLYPPTMRVECSSKMKERYPAGTVFRLRLTLKDVDTAPCLYSSYRWPFEVVSQK